MDYSKLRRSSLSASPEEFNKAFALLAKYYDIKWLESNRGHPIQELWKRKDELATNELFALSTSIRTLANIDSSWTKNQVKISKSTDKKNMQGAIFEMYGLTSLHHETHPVTPANLNQAGYDGMMKFPNNKDVRVSIKNYGMSDAQRRFEKAATETENLILTLLKKYDYPPVTIVIDSPEHYPEKEHWDLLHSYIDHVFQSKRFDPDPLFALTRKRNEAEELSRENGIVDWIVTISPMGNPTDYHQGFKTYTLIISGLYHKHEYKNLYDKMNDACFNLAKHSVNESTMLINSLFIHLPPNASIVNCYKWLTDYFNEFPDKPITFVILYQPTVATDIIKNQTFIDHCVNFFIRPERMAQWQNSDGPHFTFRFPAQGAISKDPSVNTLIMDYPDGHRETLSINERYLYQHGDHYLRMKPDGKGGFRGNIQKLGNGLFANAVIEIPGQSDIATIKGRFAPFDELLIL